MPAPGVPVQGEIVTRGGSRRSYTPQQKVRLVAETPDAEAGSRSAVAARADRAVSGRVRNSPCRVALTERSAWLIAASWLVPLKSSGVGRGRGRPACGETLLEEMPAGAAAVRAGTDGVAGGEAATRPGGFARG
jgi:hypothetical protein